MGDEVVPDPVRRASDAIQGGRPLFGVRDNGEPLKVEPDASPVLKLKVLGPLGHVGADDREPRGELLALLIRIKTFLKAADRLLVHGDSLLEAAKSVGLCHACGSQEVLDAATGKGLLFRPRPGGGIAGLGRIEPSERIVRRSELPAGGCRSARRGPSRPAGAEAGWLRRR